MHVRALVLLLTCACGAFAAPPLDTHEPPEASGALSGSTDPGSVAGLESVLRAWRAHHPEQRKTAEKEEGIDLLEAALWETRVRAFPGDRVDWSAVTQAAQAREQMQPAAWMGGRWEFWGPQNLPVPYRIYFGQGPLNGRANALAFDPVNRERYYLGAAGGGVWRTDDAGATWLPLTDHWPLLTVSALAVVKGDVVYAGTGDYPYPAQTPALGLMKSGDAGKNWVRIGPQELSHFAISKIVVDPDDSRVITVSTGRGMRQWGRVWRSADAGMTWNPVIEKPAAWCGLAIGARGAGGRRWYWAVGYDSEGWREVYRSGDRGASWQSVHKAGPLNAFSLCDVAASPVDPEAAYVLLGGLQKVLATSDGGGTFRDVTAGLPGGYNWAQDWYDLWLGCSTAKQGRKTVDALYVGLIDVAQKVGAAGWRAVGVTYTPGALAHNDQQGVAVDPFDPNHLLMASDGGAYSFRYDPARDSWAFSSLNARLGITQLYRAAFHPRSPDTVLAGTQDNASPCCLGDRLTWKNVGGGDGAYCGINPLHPEIQYASSQFLHIYRTGDNWRSTQHLGPETGNDRKAFIAPFALDPADPDRLYAGTDHLWRWDDARRAWTPRLGGQRLSAQGVVMSIAIAPSTGQRLYTGSSMGELWTSPNGGATWTRIDATSRPLPRRAITCIAVSPRRPTDVLVCVSGTGAPHAWHCPDTASADPLWQDVSGSETAGVPDAPADGLARDPADPDRRWYLASDVGVFATRDGGKTWQDATTPLGLPGVHVNDLAIVPGTGFLNAVTFGRGLWRIPVPR